MRWPATAAACLIAGFWLSGAAVAQQKRSQEKAIPGDQDAGVTTADSAMRNRPRLPGIQPSGSVLLPNQWSLRPAGRQIKLGDFPANMVLHPKLPFAAILHSGYGDHEVVIVDLKAEKVVSRALVDDSFYGLCFDSDGRQLYASGGVSETIHHFRFEDGFLSEHRQIPLTGAKELLVPCGISCSSDGKTLFAACSWSHELAIVPLDDPAKVRRIPLEKLSYPYTTLPDPSGERLFVSLWGQAAVAVLNLRTEKWEATWPTAVPGAAQGEQHPTEMVLSPDARRLFVACANSNTVTILDSQTGKPLEMVSSSLYPRAPVGSTPNSLALSTDGRVLLVANADNNNLAMFNVGTPGKAHSLGYIPVGWYPTAVRFGRGDNRIYVTNGKGISSQANPQGPNPGRSPPKTVLQYIGGLFRGTLGIIDAPSPAQMADYTKRAFACSPLSADQAPPTAMRDADNPIPAKVGDASPIKYCIYIIKENRTYDQVLGDMPEGNGDPNLCLFPKRVTPNHHALARDFVLLDNFYVESEVSADGHEWSMAAYATDFVERTWPLSYRPRGGKLGYPSEGNKTIAESSGGYLWDRAQEAGISFRSYGEFIHNPAQPGQPATTRVKTLEGHFDQYFWSFDLDYPDQKRADRFLEEFREFETNGNLPRLIILRLPNDHTAGTSLGKKTPIAMVADNDLALGRVVEAVSTSRFWKETAIFVVEDDAQNGSDHVDAHRTIALVMSPYCKRSHVDSTMYSTSSMLRTIELILGLPPMSQFDAAATPMYASFTGKVDYTPYRHLPANVDLNEVNKHNAYGAAASAKLDLAKEDAADDLLLNEIIWKSIRGADSPMPPPVRASFVRVLPKQDDDDDN
jgi:DNA-binding beta-propeller fold protein YncE